MAVMTDVAETGLLQQLTDAVAGVEPLGIELVGDHAHFVVHDNFARDQAFPVLAYRALAADKVVVIDPLPRTPIKIVVHVAAVGNVQYDLPTGAQDLTDRGQHFLDRKSTRLNSSHLGISYAGLCLKKKNATAYVEGREGGEAYRERRPSEGDLFIVLSSEIALITLR